LVAASMTGPTSAVVQIESAAWVGGAVPKACEHPLASNTQ
jgi:hypothetical protein